MFISLIVQIDSAVGQGCGSQPSCRVGFFAVVVGILFLRKREIEREEDKQQLRELRRKILGY